MKHQIEINNVTFQYPGAENNVLDNASLTIDEGEFVAIIGGNGSGKSTLCKLINGLIPHYYVGDFEGEVTVNGINTLESKVATLSEHVGYVYQDFENQLVSPKVIEDACFAPLHYGYTDYLERATKALKKVGLYDVKDAFIWQLSGGQKHLLALASILSLSPSIIIMDEPIAQLDPTHAKDIYKILKELHAEGTTIIVIEHHTEFIASFADQVVLMDKGSVVWKKKVKEAFLDVELLMKHQIYPPQVTQAAFYLKKTEINLAVHQPSQQMEESLPITLTESQYFFQKHQLDSTNLDFPIRKKEREKVVQFSGVSFGYKTLTREKTQILDGIDLTIYKGDHIALVGNNGAGKSTLMRLITGLIKPDSGSIIVNGKNISKTPPEHLAEKVTYIYQNPEQMFIDDSVEKDVSFYMKSRKVPGYKNIVNQILKQFDLVDLQERDSRLLSGGQQRRASLAIGMGMDPELMLLDEPTANLDIGTRKHITSLLGNLKDQLDAVMIATHDMQLACSFANRIIVMHEGAIIHDGDRDSVFQNQALLTRAGLESPQILNLAQMLGMKDIYTVDQFVDAYLKKEAKDGVYA